MISYQESCSPPCPIQKKTSPVEGFQPTTRPQKTKHITLPEEADPLLHELEQQPSTSTVTSERTERQIDFLALRSQTPYSDRNYDSDTTTISEYSIMAEPQDAQLVTAEEYQEYQRLKQQQTQPPPVPTMQELMERLIVVQEKTAAKESGPRIKIAEPGEFNGDPEHLRKFLNECEAYFESVPKSTESQKINCALSHMRTGNAWMFAETIRRTRESIRPRSQIHYPGRMGNIRAGPLSDMEDRCPSTQGRLP